MSGYLDVKYPLKSNLGLNPFKSWKKQWCILRPSATCGGCGTLAVYCSEAGAPAGTVELPAGCLVKRAKSRTRPHAFAVFTLEMPSKPRILLAAQSINEAQVWMDKIKDLINGDKLRGSETLLKDSYPVTVVCTELSRKCGLMSDSVLTLSPSGLLVSQVSSNTVIDWKYISEVVLNRGEINKTCSLSIDSGFSQGSGEMKFCTPLANELVVALRQTMTGSRAKRMSRSEGDLRSNTEDIGEVKRSSWYSGPSDVSLDDTDLHMSKEYQHQQLGVGFGADDGEKQRMCLRSLAAFDDSVWSRRSAVSILSAGSGVYEEIAEEPGGAREGAEHTYETVECVYGTMRRTGHRHAPPLPPRQPFGTLKLGESWNSRVNYKQGSCEEPAPTSGVSRHSSLGSLHCAKGTKHKHGFSVFRKRLKSDSRISSTKSETKEIKDVETKKKRFDFTPTRDIFKSFKVNRKMKGLKITGLSKNETKSCEFLDETEHVATNRCSKSVECLENEFDLSTDLSLQMNATNVSALALPGEIVELILNNEQLTKIRVREDAESDYVPMSPIVPAPPEQHYIVMSPRGHSA